MDADERLTDLKKAYADIILNTAKEAAARIMVSERKALRFQHELFVAKEEALQMLLRLKRTMDSKINEAEMASLSQQGKIEELEAQLQEAEDIVRDLREELRNVQAELEGVGSNKVQHMVKYDNGDPVEASEGNIASQSIVNPPESVYNSIATSDLKTPYLCQRNEHHKCYSEVIHMRNSYHAKPDLPSIILRTKEHEFYRNGCTQRIRACERNLLDGELPLSRQPNDLNRERYVKGVEESERICPAPLDEVDIFCNVDKKEITQTDSRFNNWCQARTVKSFRRKRNRITRCRKYSSPLCKSLALDNSFSNTSPNSIRNDAGSEDFTNTIPRFSSAIIEMDTQPEGAETTKNYSEYVKENGVENTINKSELLNNLLVPMGQESGCIESSFQVSITNLEKVDEPIVESDMKAMDATNECDAQPVNDRIIKYTFQRKRKRDPLSTSNGNASIEKSTSKRKSEEKQKAALDPQKPCLPTESSRDIRRLAQVARQLISLSENKWYQ